MFTGLVRDVGKIQSLDRRGGGICLTISTRLDLRDAKIGDSMAVDGVCLTMVKISERTFTVEVSPETLRRTTLATAQVGHPVNLEAALKMSDPMGGHFVTGHVDGIGDIIEIVPEGKATRYRFRVPKEIGRFLIEKGSVAVDGISLTVADCRGQEFSVSLISHTAQNTTLGKKKVGDRVNLENDLIGKYVEKFLHQRQDQPEKSAPMDEAFLAKHSFLK